MTPFLNRIGSFSSAIGAEIAAYDPARQVLYVVSGGTEIEVIDISTPQSPTQLAAINLADFGAPIAGANSISFKDGLLAVALEAATTDAGVVALVDLEAAQALQENGDELLEAVKTFTVGVLPDMVTFTPDGSKVLVANEGEADVTVDEAAGTYSVVDPEGSISIIDISGEFSSLSQSNVSTADFSSFVGQEAALRADGVRIFPDANAAQDFEPEYIAVSPDGTKAFVTLQENNAIAIVDIASATVESIKPLGLKDYSQPGNELDASDRDGGINITSEPVFGLYMPDAIASFEANGEAYYVIANEGDDRDDADNIGRGEAIRLKDLEDVISLGRNGLSLDASIDLALLEDEELGRLTISSIDGDTDGDGDLDQIVAYGGRSFSVLDSRGNIIADSGADIAYITRTLSPELFNANNGDPEDVDTRSDNKGAEPEAITTGTIDGKPYAFVGLERAGGGILMYDLSTPADPQFVQYVRSDEDVAPEGLVFIEAADSPTGKPLLAVANEVSSTVALYSIELPAKDDTDGGMDNTDGGITVFLNDGDSSDFFGTNQDDFIVGGTGENVLFGAEGNDTLAGDRISPEGDDKLFGGNGSDLLLGNGGNDILFGEAGDDSIFGQEGNDFIVGGAGFDELFGGAGSDIFALAPGQGVDIIMDFQSDDLIGLGGGIGFGDVYRVQENNKTIIGTYAGEVLAVVIGTDASQFTQETFIAV